MKTHSFCETLAATCWHIRPLVNGKQFFGGGADTETLCGLRAMWDIKSELDKNKVRLLALANAGKPCRKCSQLYLALEGVE